MSMAFLPSCRDKEEATDLFMFLNSCSANGSLECQRSFYPQHSASAEVWLGDACARYLCTEYGGCLMGTSWRALALLLCGFFPGPHDQFVSMTEPRRTVAFPSGLNLVPRVLWLFGQRMGADQKARGLWVRDWSGLREPKRIDQYERQRERGLGTRQKERYKKYASRGKMKNSISVQCHINVRF